MTTLWMGAIIFVWGEILILTTCLERLEKGQSMGLLLDLLFGAFIAAMGLAAAGKGVAEVVLETKKEVL